jgi:hypothetical protein
MKDPYLAQRIGQRFCLFNLCILTRRGLRLTIAPAIAAVLTGLAFVLAGCSPPEPAFAFPARLVLQQRCAVRPENHSEQQLSNFITVSKKGAVRVPIKNSVLIDTVDLTAATL